MTYTTPIASCNICGASWAMPRDEPHACAVAALQARIDKALEALSAGCDDAECHPGCRNYPWRKTNEAARAILTGEEGDDDR